MRKLASRAGCFRQHARNASHGVISAAQPIGGFIRHGIEVTYFQRAFPHDQDTPAERCQRKDVGMVARLVSGEFRFPICSIAHRHTAARAAVPVPLAAMNEDDRAASGKDQVGFTWQSGAVQSVAQPTCMQRMTQAQFRGCILTAHARHDEAARGLIKSVGQVVSAYGWGEPQ